MTDALPPFYGSQCMQVPRYMIHYSQLVRSSASSANLYDFHHRSHIRFCHYTSPGL